MQPQERRGELKELNGRVNSPWQKIGASEGEDEGSREQSEGAIEEKLGKARRKVGELLHLRKLP